MFPVRALFLATLVAIARCQNFEVEVRMLHVLFRHGDKVPHREFQNYPNDPYRNYSFFPIDDGGLTNEGKMREFKIGVMLRQRYNDYLGPIYQPPMVYAQSSSVPRAQMSLQLVLAGLYPPSQAQTWNPLLPWLPTSTFSIPDTQDTLLFPHYCPLYVKELDRVLASAEVQQIMGKYKDTMDYLSHFTGRVINRTSSVYFLYNLFKEQAAQNLLLPEWTRKVYPNPMREITALEFQLRSWNKDLRRLNGGVLLRKIVEDMEMVRANALSMRERKIFLFGAHEVNIAALSKTLGTNDPAIPLYGSTIILETLRNKSNLYYVRVLLWTGETERLMVQTIPGCTELCPIHEFFALTRDALPNYDEYRCSNVLIRQSSERQKKALHNELSNSSVSFTPVLSAVGKPSGHWQLGLVAVLISLLSNIA